MRSRADLRRLNWWMRNERHVLAAIRSLTQVPTTILEAGSGDGTFLLKIARRLNWKHRVRLIMLDMQPVISQETLYAFREIGWETEVCAQRIQDWLEERSEGLDLVLGNLFWHHLSDQELRDCFGRIAQVSRAFIACEPRRWRPAQISTRLLWAIGCSAVTLHDARVSVDAGFSGQELTALWPTGDNISTTEMDGGWASHIFIAEKRMTR